VRKSGWDTDTHLEGMGFGVEDELVLALVVDLVFRVGGVDQVAVSPPKSVYSR
jgi:hypothetical protein